MIYGLAYPCKRASWNTSVMQLAATFKLLLCNLLLQILPLLADQLAAR